jgi:xanthine dehydrogenase accessory factor
MAREQPPHGRCDDASYEKMGTTAANKTRCTLLRILIRGGGDLASGVAIRLHRAGWRVLITELDRPMAVRRMVSFAQAVYDGEARVEEARGIKAASVHDVNAVLERGAIPVLVDPDLDSLGRFAPHVLVDARLRKRPPETNLDAAALVIGLGPGFVAGEHCHAVIETNRGAFLGRVIWKGAAQADTGVPERVGDFQGERVLRAPAAGVVEPVAVIGARLQAGDLIARVRGQDLRAPFDGVLRGLVMAGLWVDGGEKIGDLDPRGDARLANMVSDKALAVAGGVLEAILTWEPVRAQLWTR